ncbi:MAG: efflux RND transporter periplasmic adaptor subunit [Myxococcota bacterium]
MRATAKVWLPIAFLALGAVGVVLVWATRPEATARPSETVAPLVRVVRVAPEAVQYAVRANGTVMPRTQSDLVPQVSGEVVWVSPSLVSGGFFDEGGPLLRIDARDYEAALESARAALARAESEFARARTERNRQRELAQRSVASQAQIDDADNAYRVAEAQRREARANLERAERELQRTEIRAPFEGRVRSEEVDVGQFVNRGSSIAKLYAVDFAEVRLPIPDRELAYLDLKLGTRAAAEAAESVESADMAPEPGPEVLLHAEFAGREHTWRGRVVRTEGEIDPRTRVVHVVARIEHPYAEDPPLAVGLFVSAEILGRRVDAAYVVPRTALRDGAEGPEVLVVDSDDRVRFRSVDVLRERRGEAVIGRGLAAGERVLVSPLGTAVEGMRVRVVDASSSDRGAPPRVAEAAE